MLLVEYKTITCYKKLPPNLHSIYLFSIEKNSINLQLYLQQLCLPPTSQKIFIGSQSYKGKLWNIQNNKYIQSISRNSPKSIILHYTLQFSTYTISSLAFSVITACNTTCITHDITFIKHLQKPHFSSQFLYLHYYLFLSYL